MTAPGLDCRVVATRQEDGFLAHLYHLCWCQPSDGRFGAPIYSCDGPEDFLADLGVVTWQHGGAHGCGRPTMASYVLEWTHDTWGCVTGGA